MRWTIAAAMIAVGLMSTGCITYTEAGKQSIAYTGDALEHTLKNGANPGDPIVSEALKNARLNEAIAGSPKARIPVKDVAKAASNRKQASKDAEEGGFWGVATSGTLYVLGAGAILFGLPVVGSWLQDKAAKVGEYKDKVNELEGRVTAHEGTINATVNRVANLE